MERNKFLIALAHYRETIFVAPRTLRRDIHVSLHGDPPYTQNTRLQPYLFLTNSDDVPYLEKPNEGYRAMDTKTGLKAFSDGRRDILNIDPRIIEIEPGFNGRDFSIPENLEHVAYLKASIIELGVKEPLTVRLKDGKVTLVGGECRLRGVLSAIEDGHDIKAVPCQAEERHVNDARRLVEQVVRNTGKQFTPMELARICLRLSGHGWEPSEIAKQLSKSPSYVSHLFSLIGMPEEAQQMVRSGEVSASVALGAVRSEGEVNGVATLREAVAETKTKGKKKATPATVKKVAARKGTAKKANLALNAAKTERVAKFLRWCCSTAASITEVRGEAEKVHDEIFGP